MQSTQMLFQLHTELYACVSAEIVVWAFNTFQNKDLFF